MNNRLNYLLKKAVIYGFRSIVFSGLGYFILPLGVANAQVSITLGAQEVYDDNIFLENDNRRPAPFVLNDNLLDDLRDGVISTVPSESRDGKPDEDIISNLFVDLKGTPYSTKYLDNSYKLKAGVLIFGTFSEQNRMTLDGNIRNSLSDKFLPKPYYLSINNALFSSSNNISVASGSATQTAQYYMFSGETGVKDINLSKNISYDLGYVGSYQVFLGELLLSNSSNNDTQTALNGVDYHSHIINTALKDRLSRDLEVGIKGSGGVQIFTKVENPNSAVSETQPEDLDRNNAELLGTSKYTLSKRLSFDGSAGLAYSQLQNDPEPRVIQTINEDGDTETTTIQPKDSNTGLTYNVAVNYIYRPGSLLTAGSNQGFSTNIDGQRFTSQSFFANIIEPLSDDFQLNLGTRFTQFDNQNYESSGKTKRFEGSISVNYNLTQTTSFSVGYNYSKQDGKASLVDDTLGYSEPDFTINRFFIGFNTGFVGLPL